MPQNSGRLNNYLAQLNHIQNWDQGDVRVDHQITPNDNFFARWSIQHTTTTAAPYTFPAVQIPGLPKPNGLGNEDSFAGPAFNPVQHALTVAPPLDRVVRRSLAKDPDQRFQTARHLKAALAWALEQPPPRQAGYAGLALVGDSDSTYVALKADGTESSLKLTNKEGRQQLIKP